MANVGYSPTKFSFRGSFVEHMKNFVENIGPKLAGSNRDGVIGIFNDFTFQPHYCPGVESASNKNKY
jgi:hypothetical protein